MASDDNRSQFSDLNALGTAVYEGQRMGVGQGGMVSKGVIDQTRPTGIMATGNDVSAKDGYNRGVRADMSTMRNESKMRKGADRR